MRTRLPALAMSFAVALPACGGARPSPSGAPASAAAPDAQPVPPPAMAVATLEPRSGSDVTGTAVFTGTPSGTEVVVEVAGARPGLHGVHVHENGDCSAADASSAGGHFNPGGQPHGAPGEAAHHAGDLGNVQVGPDGTGRLTLITPDLTVTPGPASVVGRAVVVHESADDLATQPSGASGARAACGVVEER